MGLDLPAGLRPAPVLFQPEEVLAGGQVVGFRFERLDRDDNLLGELTGVETGGSLSSTSANAIKTTGSISVKDIGQTVDWLNDRVRPIIQIAGLGAEPVVERPLGVYLAAAPKESWDNLGRTWDVELMDKLSVLDQDIVTDENGDPVMYVAPVGANVIELVKALIGGVGETAPAIEDDTRSLTASLTWDVGTTVLKIVNELLEVAGYASLWVDEAGQYRVTTYVSPAQRDPIYSQEAPFVVGDRSVLSPEWERDQDIYAVPNRYVAIGQGDAETEALTAVVVNDDQNSRFSFQSRGRWITRVETGVEATGQIELEARALMGLSRASSVTSGISISHRFLPLLRINEVIRFFHPQAAVDLLCYVSRVDVPLDPVALCKSEIREAVV